MENESKSFEIKLTEDQIKIIKQYYNGEVKSIRMFVEDFTVSGTNSKMSVLKIENHAELLKGTLGPGDVIN